MFIERTLFLGLTHGAGMVEVFNELGTVKDGILKLIVKIQSPMRAVDHTEHTIHAFAMIINMMCQDFFLSAILVFHHLSFNNNGVIGAYILTNAAPYALVLIELIVRENELTAKSFEHRVVLTILWVALRNLRGPKLAHGSLQPGEQRFDASDKPGKVILIFHKI